MMCYIFALILACGICTTLLVFNFKSLCGDDLIDWNSGCVQPSICKYVHTSVRPSPKSFSDFDISWFIGGPQLDMYTNVTYDVIQSQGQGH